MTIVIACIVCFSVGAAVWLGLSRAVSKLPETQVDSSHYEVHWDHVSGSYFKKDHYVETGYGVLRFFVALPLAIVSGIWVAMLGYPGYWGIASSLLGALGGYLAYDCYDRRLWGCEFKVMRTVAGVILTAFGFLTLAVALHAVIHPPSVLLAEAILLLVMYLAFWMVRPIDSLLVLPAELSARKALYSALRNDRQQIRRAEAMRRQGPGKPMSYRNLLETLSHLGRN